MSFFCSFLLTTIDIFFAAMDERLSSYALIARASIDVTIPLLTSVFSERVTRLNQVCFIEL